MLAIETMSPEVAAAFYGLAVVAFALCAFGVVLGRVGLLCLGAALFAFPSFWNSLAAS